MSTITIVEGLWRDVRHGARLLRLNPWLSIAAVLSLALGIGANSAVFGLLNALRIRSLPVANAGELVTVQVTGEGRAGRHTGRHPQVSNPLWQQLNKHQQSFSVVAAFSGTRFDLSPQGEVRYVEGIWVSGSFFPTLGVTPVIGRLFTAEDDRPGCGYFGAVISHSFWQREFGGTRDVLGQSLTVGRERVPIIGVTPDSFFGVEVGRRFEVALPICSAGLDRRDHFWLAVIGRMRPGWSLERINAHLKSLAPAILAETVPAGYRPDGVSKYLELQTTAVPAPSGVSTLRAGYEDSLVVLLAIAGLVLLLASTNLANLMLARATSRQQEFAIRLSLGASRWQVARQVLVEGFMLAIIGSLAGLCIAKWSAAFLVSMISTGLDPIHLDLSLDWRFLAFTAAVTGITCLLFSAAPAVQVTRMADSIRSSGRGMTASHEKLAFRRTLIVFQVAVCFVLVFGALLFTKSFYNLMSVDSGFQRHGIFMAHLFFNEGDLPAARRGAFYRDLTEKLRLLPDIRSLAYAGTPPLSGFFSNTSIFVKGQLQGDSNMNRVSAGYFATMGTPVLIGRDFGPQDTVSSPKVAVVTEAFARRSFGDVSPVGRTFSMPGGAGQPDTEYQVIGLVKDSKYHTIREEFAPIVFLAASQDANPALTRRYIVRANGPLGSVMSSIRRTVLEASPSAALRFGVLETQIQESLLRERLMAMLAGAFGAISIVLAAVGLYGVLSYIIARRRNEIGIRIALGAHRSGILRMVLADVTTLLSIGLATGVGFALLSARTATTLLYGLEWFDPGMLALTAATLCGTGLLAAAWPTFKASSIAPAQALRES